MREASLVKLETLLNTITVANGYAVTVSKVLRQFKEIDDIANTSFPCLIIEDDGEETITRKTGGFADVTYTVHIFGYVKDANNLSTAMNNLDTSLKKAIGSDVTLGNTVVYVEVMPYVERSGTEHHPHGFFVRPLEITYEGQTSEGL